MRLLNLDPRANRLLAALPEADFERLAPLLEPFELVPGAVLYDASTHAEHVYFPTTAVVSLVIARSDGSKSELALVGNEGVVGLAVQVGGAGTPSVAVVHSGGIGFRLAASALMQEYNRAGAAILVLLRYTQALLAQMAYTTNCNREHPLTQQLSRRLLLAMDRTGPSRLLFSEPMAADLLGVSEQNLHQAALRLYNAGIARTRLGQIEVLDRPALERVACTCYGAVTAEYAAALSPGQLAV